MGQDLESTENRCPAGSLALPPAPPRAAPSLGWAYPCLTVYPWLPSCLEFLLDNGADPSLRDRQGYTAVHYAAAYGNRQNLELVSMGTWPGEGVGTGL